MWHIQFYRGISMVISIISGQNYVAPFITDNFHQIYIANMPALLLLIHAYCTLNSETDI